jgi:hypothetical protein
VKIELVAADAMPTFKRQVLILVLGIAGIHAVVCAMSRAGTSSW